MDSICFDIIFIFAHYPFRGLVVLCFYSPWWLTFYGDTGSVNITRQHRPVSKTISFQSCPVWVHSWLCALYCKVKSRFFHPSEILWRRSWAVSMWWGARWSLPCHMRSLEPPHPCSSSCPLESTRWRTWRNTVQMHVLSKWRPFTSFHQNAAVIVCDFKATVSFWHFANVILLFSKWPC